MLKLRPAKSRLDLTSVRKPRLDLTPVADRVLNASSPGDLPIDRRAAIEARADVPRVLNLSLNVLPGVERRLLARRLVQLRLSLLSAHAVLQGGLLTEVETLTKRIANAVDLLAGNAEGGLLSALLEV